MTVQWLPKLFKKTSTGVDQYWQIGTEGNRICTHWGQVGGTEQMTQDTVESGKNIGKKNETTPVVQAQLEAQATWEKKLKKGYVKDLAAAQAGEIDECIEGGVFPMLAHKFSEQGHKIKYPCFAQPKFDGHRCIAVIRDGKATLWTRTRKPITGLPHIVEALEKLRPQRDAVYDGELYSHEYRKDFEKLSHFIRSETPEPGHEIVQYHIYDAAMNDKPFKERYRYVRGLGKGVLVSVETISVGDEDELMLAFERFLEQGYEGAMARNADGLYVNKRSYDLQKIKQFDDGEFKVIGVEEGRGKLKGHAVFVCEYEGRPFNAKMKGRLEDLKQYWEAPDLALGRMLTVKFQGYTKKNNVPRFPVALRFREDV